MHGRKTVIVVDDHEFVVNAVADLLRSPMLDIYVAESAEQALTLCKAYKVDVAFIDARMQPISGIQLIGMIHKKYPAVKIVGITTYNEEATIAEFINAGVVGFLAKGKLNKSTLQNCLQSVLAGETFFSSEVKPRLRNREMKGKID